MRGNRKTDTKPEVLLRSELHRRGIRFRKHPQLRLGSLTVRPDVVFPHQRIAVFVDGCFWHGCVDHGTKPRSNVEYWRRKLAMNVSRDKRVDAALAQSGWRSIRLWEHLSIEDAVERVVSALEREEPHT